MKNIVEVATGEKAITPRYWIAYSLMEGGSFHMLGLPSEEEADGVIRLFKETGTMLNPFYFEGLRADPRRPRHHKPFTMMKLETDMMYVRTM